MVFYKKMKKYQFTTIINPVYSRTYQIDMIIGNIGATSVIGYLGDTTNQSIHEKNITDKLYTKLIDISEQEKKAVSQHEFYKNQYFFETLLNEKIAIHRPRFNFKETYKINSNKIIIFPGAQSSFRIWDTVKFSQLISKLLAYNPNFQFHICSAVYQTNLFNDIQLNTTQKLNHHVDLAIDDLLLLLADAQLIIGSDSAPAHIAAAISKKYICLSNANHINRFVPYPDNMNIPLYVVYPNVLKELLDKDQQAVAFFNKESKIELKSISVETVYNKVIEVINL